MSGATKVVGRGTVVGPPTSSSGTARFVAGIETVMELMQADVANVILVVEDASTTSIGPIVGDAAGIVCTSGGPTSHLALVAKEFGVPCMVAATLDVPVGELDGVAFTMNDDGTLEVAEA